MFENWQCVTASGKLYCSRAYYCHLLLSAYYNVLNPDNSLSTESLVSGSAARGDNPRGYPKEVDIMTFSNYLYKGSTAPTTQIVYYVSNGLFHLPNKIIMIMKWNMNAGEFLCPVLFMYSLIIVHYMNRSYFIILFNYMFNICIQNYHIFDTKIKI